MTYPTRQKHPIKRSEFIGCKIEVQKAGQKAVKSEFPKT
jgi:hypothetical protein